MPDIAEKMTLVMQRLARQQGCSAAVFQSPHNQFLLSKEIFFKMVSFGRGCVMFLNPQLLSWARGQFQNLTAEEIMDGESLYAIEKKLRQYDRKLSGQHLRFIYAPRTHERIQPPPGFGYVFYEVDQMDRLYTYSGFNMALNYKRDVLACAAWENDQLVALAGADDFWHDCWQIGVDTLTGYRNRGLAAYLVQEIADAIEKRGYVAYYTTWAANLASVRVALKCGFVPFMIEYFTET